MEGKKKSTEPYHHVRFRWWTRVELEKISEDLRDEYLLKRILRPVDKLEIALHKDDRNELRVTSDILTALLLSFRAVLSQKVSTPFTYRDVKLRKLVSELYPRERPTPFPWLLSSEPEFEIAMSTSQ